MIDNEIADYLHMLLELSILLECVAKFLKWIKQEMRKRKGQKKRPRKNRRGRK